MKKKIALIRVLEIAGIVVSAVLVLFFNHIISFTIQSLKFYLSSDGTFVDSTVFEIKLILLVCILIVLIPTLISLFNLFGKIVAFINRFIDTNKLMHFLLDDTICAKAKLSLVVLTVGTIFGVAFHLNFLYLGLPKHEAWLERYSSFLFLIAALFLLISLTRTKKVDLSGSEHKTLKITLIGFAAIFIFIFGEEFSWGQRLFDWNSFGIFAEQNYQKETNLHNFLNPFFKTLYPLCGMTSFLVLLGLWRYPGTINGYVRQLLLPHPSLLLLAFAMACSTFAGHSESFEQMLSVFVFFYSLRIYVCLTFPKTLE